MRPARCFSSKSTLVERWIEDRAVEGVRFAVKGDFNRRLAMPNDAVWADWDDALPPNAKLTLTSGEQSARCSPRYRGLHRFHRARSPGDGRSQGLRGKDVRRRAAKRSVRHSSAARPEITGAPRSPNNDERRRSAGQGNRRAPFQGDAARSTYKRPCRVPGIAADGCGRRASHLAAVPAMPPKRRVSICAWVPPRAAGLRWEDHRLIWAPGRRGLSKSRI